MPAFRFAPCRALICLLLATHVDAARKHLNGAQINSGFEENDNMVQNVMSEDPEYDGVGVACYCKAVESVSQCEDNKYLAEPEKPGGPRFLHQWARPERGRLPHQCCKLGWTSLFSWVGWAYKRQDDLALCMSESREVPPDSCCRLEDVHGSFGLRIRKATSENMLQRDYRRPRFYKTPPEITLADITSGQDYNGEEVALKDVQEFVQTQLEAGRFKGKLHCGGQEGSFDKLFKDKGYRHGQKGSECQLRTGPSQQCCCHVASLIEASHCLPAVGAADQLGAQQQVLKSKYTESTRHGKKEGKIIDASGPDSERAMQDIIKGVVDPSMMNLTETDANETKMLWDWVKAPSQWRKKCVTRKQVPYVISTPRSKRVSDGHTMVRIGKVTQMRPKYKTKRWTDYRQGHKQGCTEWQWDRICGAGQGYYIKEIKPGQCMKEPSMSAEGEALTDLGALLFECPKDYSSGNGGTQKFNPKCECRGAGKCK